MFGAVLGIIIVLRDNWDWFEIRVILTTITVAVASLCGLACDLSRTPKGSNLLPYAGLCMTLIAAAMIIAGMWIDLSEASRNWPSWRNCAKKSAARLDGYPVTNRTAAGERID